MQRQQLAEFQNDHGLATQPALCIERGLLLKRALNQLKANKVSLVRQLRVWDWVWDWDPH